MADKKQKSLTVDEASSILENLKEIKIFNLPINTDIDHGDFTWSQGKDAYGNDCLFARDELSKLYGIDDLAVFIKPDMWTNNLLVKKGFTIRESSLPGSRMLSCINALKDLSKQLSK